MHALASRVQHRMQFSDSVWDMDVSPPPDGGPPISSLTDAAIAENGQIPGMCSLGHAFEHGVCGLQSDMNVAAELWRRDVQVYGCNVARYNLAEVYEAGSGVEKNPALAKTLYETVLAEEGLPQAAKRLARLLERGADGVKADARRSVQLYQWVVENDTDVEAMCNLGDVYREGRVGVDRHPAKAAELYQRARHEGGSSRATNSLAVMVELGYDGVMSDPARALKLYEEAVEKGEGGNTVAMVNLASLLLDGAEGVEREPVTAAVYLRRAASLGHTNATFRLARLLQKGDEGVPVNHVRAVQLYEKLVEENDGASDAKFELAWLLSGNSEQLDWDYVRAAKLYEEILAIESDISAMLNLANMLAKGHGGLDVDRGRAVAIYERAIQEHEDINAMNELGLLLCRDSGGEYKRDVERGLELLEKAQQGGHIDAKFNLALVLTDTDNGEPIDVERGMRLYEEDVRDYEHMDAMINLAELLRECCHGITPDIPRSIDLCERAIAQGLLNDEEELERIGIHLDKTYGLSDHPVAVKMREQAIRERSHLLAIGNLADTLVLQADEKDYDRALSLFERALRDSRASGTFQEYTIDAYFKSLKKVFREVQGNEALCQKAVRVYSLAIGRTGSTQLMCLLGEILMEGAAGVPRDTSKAVSLYKRAIFNEDLYAMLTLGEIVSVDNAGMAVDRRYATELFARVVEIEEEGVLSTQAIINLVLMFKDMRKSRKWG